MGHIIYHGMLMPLHDSMPSFMNFRRVLDLLEFENRDSQCLWPGQDGETVEFVPIRSMGPKHALKDTDLFFQQIYMHSSMCM